MPGVLEFALGLESSNFMRELGVSSGGLLSFAAIAEGTHFAIEKMGNAMERGAHLNDLSARTGESVANLYQLEEAFKRAGLGAEAVDPMIQKVRKALSGVNEMGGSTESIFKALGLDRATLAQENPKDAIQQITEALRKLNPNDMVGAANGLFGRGAAADMIQLANNAEDVAIAFAHSKAEAALFAKNAATFDRVGDKMVEIKSHIEGFWAGLAAGLAPELEKIEDMVAGIQFTKIGESIAESFKQGKASELLQLSIEAAFEQGTYYGERAFKALAVSTGDMFAAAMVAAFQDAIPSFFETIKTGAKLVLAGRGQDLNLQYAQEHYAAAKAAKTPEEAFRETEIGNQYVIQAQKVGDQIEAIAKAHEANQHAHILHAVDAIEHGFLRAINDGKAAWKDSPDRPHEKLDELKSFVDSMKPKPFFDFLADYKAPNKGEAGTKKGDGGYTPQVTDLEKIGLIFGNGTGGNDTARTTLSVTQKISQQHDITNDLLRILTSGNLFGPLLNT